MSSVDPNEKKEEESEGGQEQQHKEVSSSAPAADGAPTEENQQEAKMSVDHVKKENESVGTSPIHLQHRPPSEETTQQDTSAVRSNNSLVIDMEDSPREINPPQQAENTVDGGNSTIEVEGVSTRPTVVNSAGLRPHESEISNIYFTILCLVLIALISIVPLWHSRPVDLLALMCFIPAIISFVWAYLRQAEIAALAVLLYKFGFGYLVLLPVTFVGAVIALVVAIIFGTLIHAIFHWGFLTGLCTAAFLVAAVVSLEEGLKLLNIVKKDSYYSVSNPKQYVLFSFFCALGLASGETYFLCLFLRSVFDGVAIAEARKSYWKKEHNITSTNGLTDAPANAAVKKGFDQSGVDLLSSGEMLLLIFFCVILIIPMHILSGYHMGLGAARRDVLQHRDVTAPKIMVIPCAARFIFTFSVIFLPAFVRHWFPYILAMFFCVGYIFWVKRYERKMPRDYLARTGYMSAFGYGALLNTADEEDTVGATREGVSQELRDVPPAHHPV